jgi:acyl carrier protein
VTPPTPLWTDVRNHIDTEVRVLTWVQADAAGQESTIDPAFEDLDSFTFIQLVLSLEAEFDVELLEDLGEFRGTSFDDVADFVSERVARARAGTGAPR